MELIRLVLVTAGFVVNVASMCAWSIPLLALGTALMLAGIICWKTP